MLPLTLLRSPASRQLVYQLVGHPNALIHLIFGGGYRAELETSVAPKTSSFSVRTTLLVLLFSLEAAQKGHLAPLGVFGGPLCLSGSLAEDRHKVSIVSS